MTSSWVYAEVESRRKNNERRDEDPVLHRTAFDAAFGATRDTRASGFEMLKLLLRAGVDINQTDLKGQTALVRVEIQAGMDKLTLDQFNYINSPTPLMMDYMRVRTLLMSIMDAIDALIKSRVLQEVQKVRSRLHIMNQEFIDILGCVCATSADIDLDNMLETVNTKMRVEFGNII